MLDSTPSPLHARQCPSETPPPLTAPRNWNPVDEDAPEDGICQAAAQPAFKLGPTQWEWEEHRMGPFLHFQSPVPSSASEPQTEPSNFAPGFFRLREPSPSTRFQVNRVQRTPSPSVPTPQRFPLVVSGVEGSPCVIGVVNPIAGNNPIAGDRRTVELNRELFPDEDHDGVALPNDAWVAPQFAGGLRLEPFFVPLANQPQPCRLFHY